MAERMWVDASQGMAADLLLAALIDAGAGLGPVSAAVTAVIGAPVDVETAEVHHIGQRARIAAVPRTASGRRLPDLLRVIHRAQLAPPVARFSAQVLLSLAAAESRVRGGSVDEVSLDAGGEPAAVAACAAALHELGLLAPDAHVTVGPVGLGTGSADVAAALSIGSGTPRFGRRTVPLPTVLELLSRSRAPIHGVAVDQPLCTPVGAALVSVLANSWGPGPLMTLQVVGVGTRAGAGGRSVRDEPEASTRVLVGATVPKTAVEAPVS